MRVVIPLVLLLLAVAATSCGGSGATQTATASPGPSRTATPRPTPSASPTASPTPSPAPTPLTIDTTGSQPRQGGFLFVRYPDDGSAAAPMAYFAATGYAMERPGGVMYAFIGLPADTVIGDHPLEVWDGDTLLASASVAVVDGAFTRVSFDLPPSSVDLLTDQARIDRERALLASTEAVVTPVKYWSGPWQVPVEGEVSSYFGEMRSENGGPFFPHLGEDIANDVGTPVYAAADGVIALNQQLLLYGNTIVIDHGVGVFSAYSHLDSSLVTEGQTVARGDLIGYMGETGYVTGPHLHWEAIVHGTRVNASLFTLGGTDP